MYVEESCLPFFLQYIFYLFVCTAAQYLLYFQLAQNNRRMNGQGQKNMVCKEANLLFGRSDTRMISKGFKRSFTETFRWSINLISFCLSVTWKCSVYVETARERLSQASVAAVPRYDSTVCHWRTETTQEKSCDDLCPLSVGKEAASFETLGKIVPLTEFKTVVIVIHKKGRGTIDPFKLQLDFGLYAWSFWYSLSLHRRS